MKLKYLGTAAAEGWPAVFCGCDSCNKARTLGGKNIRTRSQAIIDNQLLIDLSPDTYMHSLQHSIELHRIQSILVTHSHQDHFYPLELILRGAPYGHNHEASTVTIYGNKTVENFYNLAMEQNDSPETKKMVHFKEVKNFESFVLSEGYTITPLTATHDRRENCFIYLIEKNNGKTILYGHDTGVFPQETWGFLANKKVDFVTLDCTLLRRGEGTNHMGLPDNRIVKERLLTEGIATVNTIFAVNHFSHNGALMHDEIVEIAKEDGFVVSYDGLEIVI